MPVVKKNLIGNKPSEIHYSFENYKKMTLGKNQYAP